MVLRITTWNVNGIRNPFGYQPWRSARTFEAMFDILEADIVIMQELKIQRKDLRDDMVLVPGWDCYFSLPKHKKGYSGVGIYTRQSVCAPIRAEEGILGALCPRNSTVPYCDLPEDEHVGGYLNKDQIACLGVDAADLDSEGRCAVVEFPAFVLFGIYAPANSNGERDDFRHAFHSALDTRIRNLVAHGKRVVVTGDLNVSRDEMDTANAAEKMRKEGITHDGYLSTPNRRIFNQLLEGGEVIGERDECRGQPVLWDVCRGFHPGRKGMFTHWEQKINARPGNFGSRIDFILCSLDMKSWFSKSNIQEGLMGSDHCPVYAVINDTVQIHGCSKNVKDVMNPSGTFEDGKRLREYSTKDIPAFSGKLLPEFDKRRSIKDMFGKRPSLVPEASFDGPSMLAGLQPPINGAATSSVVPLASQPAEVAEMFIVGLRRSSQPTTFSATAPSPNESNKKRPAPEPAGSRPFKRSQSGSNILGSLTPAKGQQSLKGFFKPKASVQSVNEEVDKGDGGNASPLADVGFQNPSMSLGQNSMLSTGLCSTSLEAKLCHSPAGTPHSTPLQSSSKSPLNSTAPEPPPPPDTQQVSPPSPENIHDPIVSKESWSRLFTKPAAPRCEHEEPCKTMKTKKTGFNCGREFWMCARPLGPTGAKERNTQWRCPTFIWTSDYNGRPEKEP